MVQVQTPGRILYYIGDQLAGGHGILQENGFKELDLILLAAVGVRQVLHPKRRASMERWIMGAVT